MLPPGSCIAARRTTLTRKSIADGRKRTSSKLQTRLRVMNPFASHFFPPYQLFEFSRIQRKGKLRTSVPIDLHRPAPPERIMNQRRIRVPGLAMADLIRVTIA